MSPDMWTIAAVLLLAVLGVALRRQIAEWIGKLREEYAPQETEEQDLALAAGSACDPDPEFVQALRKSRTERNKMTRADSENNKAGRRTRLRLNFWGRVQGVGFRYQAMHAARAYDLTGWIENKPDGSVEMEVQGPEDDIGRLVTHLRQAKWIRILSMDVEELPLRENERGFRVLGY